MSHQNLDLNVLN